MAPSSSSYKFAATKPSTTKDKRVMLTQPHGSPPSASVEPRVALRAGGGSRPGDRAPTVLQSVGVSFSRPVYTRHPGRSSLLRDPTTFVRWCENTVFAFDRKGVLQWEMRAGSLRLFEYGSGKPAPQEAKLGVFTVTITRKRIIRQENVDHTK